MKHKLKLILHQHPWAIWILIFIITLLWGYAWVYMKQGLEYMGPFTFSAFRFGTGSMTMLLVVLLTKASLPEKRHWKHLAILGFLQTTVVFLLVMYALYFVGAGKSSVLLYSMPVWSSLLAVKFLGEKLTTAKSSGLAFGFIGLLTILGWDLWIGQSMEVIVGELLIVISAISWGIANVYYRVKLQDMPQLQVNTWQMVFGTIGIIITALFMEWGEPIILNSQSVYYILFTGVLASALCFTVWFIILRLIDMVTATISTLLVPVFGLSLSWLILDEALTVNILIGSGLILIGIVVANKSNTSGSVSKRECK